MPARVERTTPTALRPETELLLLCARTRMGPEQARRIRELLTRGLDWIFFVRDALSHDLLPLAYVHLRAVGGSAVPAGILERLGRYFDEHIRRTGRLTEELVRVRGVLDANSIPALPFKGPTLAVAAYGDPALRTCCDLDLLVRRGDAPRAGAVLGAAGYRLDHTPLDRAGFPSRRGVYEYCFRRDGDGAIAELHFRLTPLHLRQALDFERLGGRRQVVTLNGVTVPTLTPEDMLLVLCVHGDKHYWGVLKWICDVAELVGATPRMNWRYVGAQARALGCRRMVALGLRLASGLLGAPLPGNESGIPLRDARIARLAARVQAQLFDQDDAARPYDRLELVERFPDRLWIGVEFARRVLTVGPDDRRLLPLPGPLRPAYYPLRLIRLLAKYALLPLARQLRDAIRPIPPPSARSAGPPP